MPLSRLANRDLLVATFALSVTSFTMGAMRPVLPLYAKELGASAEQWGTIAAAWGLAMALGEPFWGWVHDQFDQAAPYYFRLISATLLFLSLMIPIVFWPLYLLNFWQGFNDASTWPTSRSIASHSMPGQVALAMGVLTTGARLGLSLGALIGGLVADYYGFKQTFLLMAIVSLGAGLIIIPHYGLPHRRFQRRRRSSAIEKKQELATRTALLEKSPTRHNPLLLLLGITIATRVGWLGTLAFIPLVVTGLMEGTVADAGIVFNISALVAGLMIIPMGRFSDRMGPRRLVIAGLLLSASSVAGMAFAGSFDQLLVLVALGALGEASYRPSMDALVSTAAPIFDRGRIMGLYGTSEDMGGIVGPLLGGVAWRLGGPTATFIVLSTITSFGILASWIGLNDKIFVQNWHDDNVNVS